MSAYDTLSILERNFVDAMIATGGNQTQSYLIARPTISNNNSAHTLAHRMLQKVTIQQAIEEKRQERLQSTTITKELITSKLMKISQKAEEAESYTPAVNALDKVAQLHGLYDKSDDNAVKYVTLIQSLTVNNVSNQEEKCKDIETIECKALPCESQPIEK